jgi:hypothetical protein
MRGRKLSEMNEQIDQAATPRRPGLLAVVLIAGVPLWVLTVANLVGDFGSGRIDPTAVDIIAMIVLMAVPLLVGALVEVWIRRRD